MSSVQQQLHDLIQTMVQDAVQSALAKTRQNPPQSQSYMSTAEAGEYARVSQGTIRRWISAGRLDASHAGRELRISRADLDALMSSKPRRRAKIAGRVASPLTPEAQAMADLEL